MIIVIRFPKLKINHFFGANNSTTINKMFGYFTYFGHVKMTRH